MRRYWYLAVAAATASALAVLPLTASAATGGVLIVGSAEGTSVNPGDALSGTLSGSATFFNSTSGSTGITCTRSSAKATDSTNPAEPGTATESLTAQTFDPTSCTINVGGARSVQSITINNLPYPASINDNNDVSPATVTLSAGSAGPIQTTVVIVTIFGNITCVYQPNGGSLTGTAPLDSSSGITFKNAQFNKTSGSGLCPGTSFFSATYGFVDTSQGSQAVFTS